MWIISFDFGLKRIGVAVGNTQIKIPHPVGVIKVNSNNQMALLKQIKPFITKWQPSILVVGMPSNNSVTLTANAIVKHISTFIEQLKQEFKLPVVTVNEDYTSSVASIELNEQEVYARAQKGKLDDLAACLILQTYFTHIHIS